MVDVPSGNLVLSGFAPETTFSSPNFAIPSANLTLSSSTSELEPPSANLVLTLSTPTVLFTTSANIEVPTGDLVLSARPPVIRIVIPWVSPEDNPSLLCPMNISVNLSTVTESPAGRSLSGKKQFVQADVGFWIIILDRIRINTRQDVLAWRKIEGGLNGRVNATLISIPTEDNDLVVTVDQNVAMGATTVFLDVASGGELEEGMHFSVGERLYRIKEIVDFDSGTGVYELLVRPPVREAITASAVANFTAPVCRCRLMKDDGMNITHELMRISRPTVMFCEDWVVV